MQRKSPYLLSGLLLCCLAVSTLAHGQEGAEQKAVEAARKWLRLVDARKYTESWQEAAAYFKNAVTENQWNQAVNAARGPLGGVASRELKSTQYSTSLPGAPDGQYVVVQFDTSFEHKRHSVETITPMLEQDGVWRVSGYYIR